MTAGGKFPLRKLASLVNAIEVNNCFNSMKILSLGRSPSPSYFISATTATSCSVDNFVTRCWWFNKLAKSSWNAWKTSSLLGFTGTHWTFFWWNDPSSCLWHSETHRKCRHHFSIGFPAFLWGSLCMILETFAEMLPGVSISYFSEFLHYCPEFIFAEYFGFIGQWLFLLRLCKN